MPDKSASAADEATLHRDLMSVRVRPQRRGDKRAELIEAIMLPLYSVVDPDGKVILIPNVEKWATTIADAMLAGETNERKPFVLEE